MDIKTVTPAEFGSHTNNCAILAMQAVTGLPYKIVDFIARCAGRKTIRSGTPRYDFIKECEALGMKFREVPIYHELQKLASTICRKGRYYVIVDRLGKHQSHALAIIDGKITDNGGYHHLDRVSHCWKLISISKSAFPTSPYANAP